MIYVFADCELDTDLYTLHRAGQPVRLRPKVYQVLTYLLMHHTRVVSKQELCEQVWSARAISDAAIENTMKVIRHATGDDGRRQQVIQTCYGHGYRFVAPVTISSAVRTITASRDPASGMSPAPFQGALWQETSLLPVSNSIARPFRSHNEAPHAWPGGAQQHQQVAQVLAAQFPEMAARHPALLAYHYTAAGRSAQAISYWHQAGQHAVERSAYSEAVAYFQQGLALLQAVPMTSERARQELRLHYGLALPLSIQGTALQEVEQTYVRALELAHQVGTPQELCGVLRGLAWLYKGQGAFQRARACGEHLLALSQRLHDPTLLLWSHTTLGEILLRLGEFTSARNHLEQGLTYYTPSQHRRLIVQYGLDPGLVCLGALSWTLWYLGYPEQALQRSQEALRLAEGFAHPYSLGLTLTYAAALHGLRQEMLLTQERAEALQQLATTHGFARLLASATRYQGIAWFWQGQPAGIGRIQQGIAALHAMQTREARASQLTSLAGIYAHIGHVEHALPLLHEAIATAQDTEERYAEAHRYSLMGELLLQRSPPDLQQAERWLRHAVAVARRQHAKAWELQASMRLSRLLQQQGQRAIARQMLAAVYARFTEGFATTDLQQARVRIEQLA